MFFLPIFQQIQQNVNTHYTILNNQYT